MPAEWQVEEPQVELTEDGWVPLVEAIDLMPDPEPRINEALQSALEAELSAEAEAVAAQFEPAMERAGDVAERPYLRYPATQEGFRAARDAADSLRVLAMAHVLAARLELENGRTAEAQQRLSEGLELEQALFAGMGGEAYFAAAADYAIALHLGLRQLVGHEAWGVDDLETLRRTFAESRPDFLERYRETMAYEVQEVWEPQLQGFGVRLGSEMEAERGGFPSAAGSEDWNRFMARALLDHPEPYNQEATRSRLYELFMHLYAQVGEPWAEVDLQPYDEEIGEVDRLWGANVVTDTTAPGSLLSPEASERLMEADNPAGRQAMLAMLMTYLQQTRFAYYTATNSAATEVVLWLEAQERETGSLPGQLAPELPRDPMSGEKFGYDPQSRRLWSVGLNGQDDGGSYDEAAGMRSPDWLWPL